VASRPFNAVSQSSTFLNLGDAAAATVLDRAPLEAEAVFRIPGRRAAGVDHEEEQMPAGAQAKRKSASATQSAEMQARSRPSPTLQRFHKEIESLEESAAKQRRNRTRWVRVFYAVGVPGALLAAAAGLGSLGGFIPNNVVGWLAIAAALVTALNVSLRPRSMAQRAKAKARGYRDIAALMQNCLAQWEEQPPSDASEVREALDEYLRQRISLEDSVAETFEVTDVDGPLRARGAGNR
jgi:hypothetical protein